MRPGLHLIATLRALALASGALSAALAGCALPQPVSPTSSPRTAPPAATRPAATRPVPRAAAPRAPQTAAPQAPASNPAPSPLYAASNGSPLVALPAAGTGAARDTATQTTTPLTVLPPASPKPHPAAPRNDALYALGMPLPHLPTAEEPAATGTAGDNADGAALLTRTMNRTGLTDADLQRLLSLEQPVHAGNAAALQTLRNLDAELAAAAMLYTVKSGDHLWTIAARTGIYGNRSLWPLIWNANRESLPAPESLHAGQVLRIPLHPTADELGAALAWSRTHAAAP